MNNRLTLNLGLRWEMHPSPRARDNNFMTFDIKNDAIVLPKPINDFIANGLHHTGPGHEPAKPRCEIRDSGAGRHSLHRLLEQHGEFPAARGVRVYARRSGRRVW